MGDVDKITAQPIIRTEDIYRDEALAIIKRLGDNIPTMVNLLEMIEVMRGLADDLLLATGKITKEISPVVKDLRERFEREESLTLIKKLGDNIPTFITLLDLMETAKNLINDLQPTVGRLSKEMMPSINMLREAFEKDEVLELFQKTGESIATLNKLLNFLKSFEKTGTLDFTLEQIASKEMNCMMVGMQKCVVRTVQELIEKPPKPGLKGMFAAIRDPEVQKGIMIMTALARNMSLSLSETFQDLSGKQ